MPLFAIPIRVKALIISINFQLPGGKAKGSVLMELAPKNDPGEMDTVVPRLPAHATHYRTQV